MTNIVSTAALLLEEPGNDPARVVILTCPIHVYNLNYRKGIKIHKHVHRGFHSLNESKSCRAFSLFSPTATQFQPKGQSSFFTSSLMTSCPRPFLRNSGSTCRVPILPSACINTQATGLDESCVLTQTDVGNRDTKYSRVRVTIDFSITTSTSDSQSCEISSPSGAGVMARSSVLSHR